MSSLLKRLRSDILSELHQLPSKEVVLTLVVSWLIFGLSPQNTRVSPTQSFSDLYHTNFWSLPKVFWILTQPVGMSSMGQGRG